MKLGMKSGQVLILVLLIVVVALAIGLSVASRNIINLRTSTQTEQSQRAFSAAEGGVEKVLTDIPGNLGQKGIDVGNLKATVNVVASKTYERSVALGDVAQIDLNGANANAKVQVEWAKAGENASDGFPASIEVTQIYGPTYTQQRFYFQGDSSHRTESGTFSSSSCSLSGPYRKCVQVTILTTDAKILRIKPFWANTSVKVSGGNIPTQTYDITSTASTEIGVTRKVQVTRTALPQLPAIFDYVLYSEGDIVK